MPDPDVTPELSDAYRRGNFAWLRRRARALSTAADSGEAIRASAKAWLAQLSVDVSVYAVLGFALLLFCAIVARYALP